MNTPTLRDLRDQILNHGPEHLEMHTILMDKSSQDPVSREQVQAVDFDNCGTVGCLAGHAAVLMAQNNVLKYTGADPHEEHYYYEAIEYFKLPMPLTENMWEVVPFGDSTLAEHEALYRQEGMSIERAIWHCVLDWLDVEIKKRES